MIFVSEFTIEIKQMKMLLIVKALILNSYYIQRLIRNNCDIHMIMFAINVLIYQCLIFKYCYLQNSKHLTRVKTTILIVFPILHAHIYRTCFDNVIGKRSLTFRSITLEYLILVLNIYLKFKNKSILTKFQF